MGTNDPNEKTEAQILKFWQDKQIFEKSLAKPAPAGEFVFYDGPPFATGLPHFGHVLPTALKDAIPRYKTMRGYRVERRWGWDCHGLPIENLIEKELGLESKKAIEDYGIAEFNQKARASVLRYADEWAKIIPRLGRWVDIAGAYRSMDPAYTESVWWAFQTLFEKGLVYEGYKSMHLCPRCGTTLANFEVGQGYQDITDLAVTVKFELADEPGTYLLVWTTTPWTLPGNAALAVNPTTNYVRIKTNDANYILAKARLAVVLRGQSYEILEEFLGEKLIGQKYKTVFDYYLSEGQVHAADFVTTDDGTGVVHIAPAFGEDDLALGEREKLPLIQPVDAEGCFKSEVRDFAGAPVKPKGDHQATDILIIKHLAQDGALFAKEKITHSYPHCWRCETPLLNYAASSWFIKVTALKERLVALNQSIKWTPEHLGAGRFGKWLTGARDWAVSRARFWGAPLPVWRCAQCQKVEVLGSLEALKQKTRRNNYWLMRHGEAESNVRGIVSGAMPGLYSLTARGQAEVARAAADLANEKIDLIVASPVLRTQETAKLLADKLGLKTDQIIYEERLREVVFGDEWEGRSVDDYHAAKILAGVETPAALAGRALAGLYDLDARYHQKNILLITHQMVADSLAASGANFATGEWRPLDFVPRPHNENFELDFHRPYIDEIKWACECGGVLTRVPEVFDVWFESGSMPYAQWHYPFENQELFKQNFPADFIAEGLDQTRGWFYVLLVLAAGLFDETAFKSVIVNGLILAEDGRKMSKRFNNYPELGPTIERYGADALRFYLLSSPAVRAEEFNFSERGLGETARRVIGRLKNVLAFYEIYKTELDEKNDQDLSGDKNILDRWILGRLAQVHQQVTENLDHYLLDQALKPLDSLIDDLSTWYLRRSRERFKSDDERDKQFALQTLRQVLHKLSKLLAPFTPFVAEMIWQSVKIETDEESVHLAQWAKPHEADESVLAEMARTRALVSRGLELRAEANLKVRQPLAALTVDLDLPAEYQTLVKDELNVLAIKKGAALELDTTLTPSLIEQGELRELARELQAWRKKQGLAARERVVVQVPRAKQALAEKYEAELKRATRAQRFEFVD